MLLMIVYQDLFYRYYQKCHQQGCELTSSCNISACSLKSDDIERTSATSKDALIDNNDNSNSSITPEMQDARMELYATDNDSDKKLSDSNVSGESSDSVDSGAAGGKVDILMGDDDRGVVVDPYLECARFVEGADVLNLNVEERAEGENFEEEEAAAAVKRREKRKKKRKCSGCGQTEVSSYLCFHRFVQGSRPVILVAQR